MDCEHCLCTMTCQNFRKCIDPEGKITRAMLEKPIRKYPSIEINLNVSNGQDINQVMQKVKSVVEAIMGKRREQDEKEGVKP